MPADAAFCPACGQSANANEQRDQNQQSGSNQNYHYLPYPMKDTGITLVLGVLLGIFGIMGVGQLYVGRVKRGIAIMIGGVAIALTSYYTMMYILLTPWVYNAGTWIDSGYSQGFIGFATRESVWSPYTILFTAMAVAMVIRLAYLFWQAYDAYKLAKHYNEELIRTGKPPW